MRRAIVLLGAGASVEYKAPSTPALTKAIERQVLADPCMNMSGGAAAFTVIKSRLDGYLQGQVNFEQIYHCAHELRFASPPSPGAADVSQQRDTPCIKRVTLGEDTPAPELFYRRT